MSVREEAAGMDASRQFAGKRVMVMGLGRFGGGIGVTRWLVAQGARVTVTDPSIAVVESVELADPAALDTAITLFVKWAIRAHESATPEAPEAPTDQLSAD